MKTTDVQIAKTMILRVNESGYTSTKQCIEKFLDNMHNEIKTNNFINSLTDTWFDVYTGVRNRKQRFFSEKQAFYLAKYMVENGFLA